MNDLGHYWAADPEYRREPDFALGLVLPDLTREVAPRARFTTEWLDAQHGGEMGWLIAGVREHMRHDDVWHDLKWFAERRREARQAMEAAGLSGIGLRLFFLDHVLVELTLDHVLLGWAPRLAEEYHQSLMRGDVGLAALLAERLPGEPAMEERLRRYVARPRVFYYAEAEAVVDALARVAARARQRVMSEGERAHMVGITRELAGTMRETMGELEKAMLGGL